jgi:hypothetical protein
MAVLDGITLMGALPSTMLVRPMAMRADSRVENSTKAKRVALFSVSPHMRILVTVPHRLNS